MQGTEDGRKEGRGRHAAGLLRPVDAAHLLLGIAGCLLLRPLLLLLLLSLGLGLLPQPGDEEEQATTAELVAAGAEQMLRGVTAFLRVEIRTARLWAGFHLQQLCGRPSTLTYFSLLCPICISASPSALAHRRFSPCPALLQFRHQRFCCPLAILPEPASLVS